MASRSAFVLALCASIFAHGAQAQCPDADGDTICDAVDNCPIVYNPAQEPVPDCELATPPVEIEGPDQVNPAGQQYYSGETWAYNLQRTVLTAKRFEVVNNTGGLLFSNPSACGVGEVTLLVDTFLFPGVTDAFYFAAIPSMNIEGAYESTCMMSFHSMPPAAPRTYVFEVHGQTVYDNIEMLSVTSIDSVVFDIVVLTNNGVPAYPLASIDGNEIAQHLTEAFTYDSSELLHFSFGELRTFEAPEQFDVGVGEGASVCDVLRVLSDVERVTALVVNTFAEYGGLSCVSGPLSPHADFGLSYLIRGPLVASLDARVSAHEIGHLIGLHHVAEAHGVEGYTTVENVLTPCGQSVSYPQYQNGPGAPGSSDGVYDNIMNPLHLSNSNSFWTGPYTDPFLDVIDCWKYASALNYVDRDLDGSADATDKCPLIFDPYQQNEDGDAAGDACDPCKSFPNTAPIEPGVIPGECLCGDADGDGEHEISDGLAILSCVSGSVPCEMPRMDVDGDGPELSDGITVLQELSEGTLVDYLYTCERRPEGTPPP